MPGVAPVKVQHWALRISRIQGKEYTPVWDDQQNAWTVTVEEDSQCDDLLHELMREETGDCYDECVNGHKMRVVLRFRRGGFRQGMRPWRMHSRVQVDGVLDFELPASEIVSLLSKPTNPQGDSKAAAASTGTNKQQMRVKRTTVIRV